MRTPFPSSDAHVNDVIRSWLKFLKEILSKRELISSSLQSFLSVFCHCSRNLITDITYNRPKYNEFRSTLLYPANSFMPTSKEYFASQSQFFSIYLKLQRYSSAQITCGCESSKFIIITSHGQPWCFRVTQGWYTCYIFMLPNPVQYEGNLSAQPPQRCCPCSWFP